MKGTLPKPTLLELDEYDINQRVIEALTTTCSHAVLFSIVNVEKDVVEISNELQISLSTTYKALTNLEKLSLVEIQRFKITDDGKKIKMYRSRIKKADISKLKEDCLADKEYMNEIVALLNENIEEFYETTAISIKAKERFSISRAAHKVRNGLEMVKANSLLDYLDMIQKECQHLNTYDNISNLISGFKNEYIAVLNEIRKQINELDA